MLELYHNVNSVCAQKVRIALQEKGLEAKEHLLTLRGDQNDPAYHEAQSQRRGADAGARRTADRRIVADPLLPR